ncbi:MAG: hypothetical protein KDA80_06430 [Planctomycetaceae bacterium]|nr:hypothetical protein [Planctomycetaceae bacterium]
METSNPSSKSGVFLKWELLRVPFNGILIAVCLSFSQLTPLSWGDGGIFWSFVQWILIANLLFFACPLIERAAANAGIRHFWLTAVLFWAGLFLATFLTVLQLFLWTLRHSL